MEERIKKAIFMTGILGAGVLVAAAGIRNEELAYQKEINRYGLDSLAMVECGGAVMDILTKIPVNMAGGDVYYHNSPQYSTKVFFCMKEHLTQYTENELILAGYHPDRKAYPIIKRKH